MVNDPDEPRETLAFGDPERRYRLFPGEIRLPGMPAIVAGIVIGGLALAVVALALRGSAPSRAQPPVTTQSQPPVTITEITGSSVRFPLAGTAGALLSVQYLQAGNGPATIWATLAVSGLPRGIDYAALAGDCITGRPRVLALASALPDPRTDLLILPLQGISAPVTRLIWIRVTSAPGADLGGARGTFLLPGAAGSAVPSAPGQPVCP